MEEVGYGKPTRLSTHGALRAEGVDEPQVGRFAKMLEALGPEAAKYCSCESRAVADLSSRGRALFEELQGEFGFVGGVQLECERFFGRPDLHGDSRVGFQRGE